MTYLIDLTLRLRITADMLPRERGHDAVDGVMREAATALDRLMLVSEIAEAFARSVFQNGAMPSDESARQLQDIARAVLSDQRGGNGEGRE